MRRHTRPIIISTLAIAGLALFIIVLARSPMDVLNPAGQIASSQKQLLITATLLMLLIVVPVFILTFYIAYTYRAGNKKARYQPEWDHNNKLETIWWGFPLLIVGVLAVLTWTTSHSLDPAKPIASDKQPLTVQVVALQWKWLFIYPDQNIATVNYLKIPAGRPVNFEITADAPMNSFWIPRLGGQIYAMSGMTTRLHLEADKPGIYNGSSANISGSGFAAMHFTAESTTEADFTAWTNQTKAQQTSLGSAEYQTLASPGVPKALQSYGSVQAGLYDTVLMKYMDGSHTIAGAD